MRVIDVILRIILHLPFAERFNVKILHRLGALFVGAQDSVWVANSKFVGGPFRNLTIGEHSNILDDCFFLLRDKIIIGNNVDIAYRVTLITSSNASASSKIRSVYPPFTAPVTIEDDVWIGANATILGGVTVGKCSVVAAGSLVNKDVEPYTVVAGVPARVIKRIVIE